MKMFALLGAAVLPSAISVTPVAAQEVIPPGYRAQFHPNANCQSKGANDPYTGDYQARNEYRIRLPGSRVPAPRAPSSIAAAMAAGITATERTKTDRRLLTAAGVLQSPVLYRMA